MKNVLAVVMIHLLVVCCGCAVTDDYQKKASYHYQMGLSHLTEGNYTRALVDLTEAEKITPDDPQLLHSLGQAYYFKHHYDLAEQKYLKAIRIRPDFSSARNDLGVNYLEMKRWDDAIEQLTIVTNDIFFQDHDKARMNLALAYLGKGETAKALSFIRPVVSRNPREPSVRLNLGRIYFAEEKTDLAIEEFKKAIELNNDFATAHYQLGLAYLKAGDNAAAETEFREVIRIEPDSELGLLSREHVNMLK